MQRRSGLNASPSLATSTACGRPVEDSAHALPLCSWHALEGSSSSRRKAGASAGYEATLGDVPSLIHPCIVLHASEAIDLCSAAVMMQAGLPGIVRSA